MFYKLFVFSFFFVVSLISTTENCSIVIPFVCIDYNQYVGFNIAAFIRPTFLKVQYVA